MYNISPDAIQINRRFFEALDALKRGRRLSGIYGFSQKYKTTFANIYTIKNQESGVVKVEWLMYLVRDYDISAQWLLTGEGNMFKQTTAKTL